MSFLKITGRKKRDFAVNEFLNTRQDIQQNFPSERVGEYHEYKPITGTNLNNSGDIIISIESQDMLAHLSESYLIFEGNQIEDDDTACANANEVALTNNGIMHLFSQIEYHLSNKLIDSLSYPGQATTMYGLLK